MSYKDRHGRTHDDLRVSVTDRCNLRCGYCMPAEPEWFPRSAILSYEELARLVRVLARGGVRKVRITGGEPLARRDLPEFVRMVRDIEAIDEISLTTNAVLLDGQAAALAAAGLRGINVSLDTLRPDRFEALTRRPVFDRVLQGLHAAREAGLDPIKINTVLIRGVNDDEIEPLVRWAREREYELRFIEFMPLDNMGNWIPDDVVRGREVRERIRRLWPLAADPRRDPHAPARRWRFVDGAGAVGFIDSVSHPFCGDCNRLRVTADGRFLVCLYDTRGIDLRAPLRDGASDAELETLMTAAVLDKGRGGAVEILERREAPRTALTMHQIGG